MIAALGIVGQLASGVLGFAGRYVPDMVGKWQEGKREEKNMKLQLLIEKERAASAKDIKMMDREALEAINAIQLEIAALTQQVKATSDARKYGLKLGSMMDQTLARAKVLGIRAWVIDVGWVMVLMVEMFSAIVQPAIAVCVFTIWMICKIKEGSWAFGTEDWMLLDAVVGFFLAGRVKKHDSIKEKNQENPDGC